MATGAMDCDFMYDGGLNPESFQEFVQKADAFGELIQFTPTNEHKVYDEVDVTKRKELRQDGKVVVITGAGRGIGRGVAHQFAKAHARAIFICARTTSELEEVRKELLEIDPDVAVHLQQVDVTDDEAVKSLFETAKQKFGGIDIGVANAGSQREMALISGSTTDKWWGDFTINVKGLYLFTKYFAQTLGNKQGTLVNISSTSALGTLPGQSAYVSSKLTGMRMVENLHLESPNIRSFNLHPGIVETKMMTDMTTEMGVSFKMKFTEPELTGAVILWLSTASAEFLRGRFVSVNWKVNELEAMKDDIVRHKLLKSAFNAKLGK